jgi:hypothetical protein
MERLVAAGTQVLIPPDSSRRRGTRPGSDGGLYAFMRRVLATDLANELYRPREHLIEPVAPTPSSTEASAASTDQADRPPAPNGA